MCCNMYLDEHVCKDSSLGGAGLAIHLRLSWLVQLATSFPTHCSNCLILQLPASLMKGRFMYQIVEH